MPSATCRLATANAASASLRVTVGSTCLRVGRNVAAYKAAVAVYVVVPYVNLLRSGP